ncbi:MAG: hypothetical protein IPN90_12080 [Elusimicrobia bacterium]|nr:hypothetical protein [Elusimicrobiota bacterium]
MGNGSKGRAAAGINGIVGSGFHGIGEVGGYLGIGATEECSEEGKEAGDGIGLGDPAVYWLRETVPPVKRPMSNEGGPVFADVRRFGTGGARDEREDGDATVATVHEVGDGVARKGIPLL